MIDFIRELASAAGKLAAEGRRTLSEAEIHTKRSSADLVTAVDRRVEEFICAEIRRRHPGHGIFGEETGRSGDPAEYCWIIDPIDGTTSFVHGFPYYSVSIALQYRGRTVAGAVCAPELGELFHAEAGKGAFLNGGRIRVSATGELSRALLATGFGCVRARMRPDNFDYLPEITRRVQDIRRCGSAALDLCNVAAGRFDGYWEFALQSYDIAAGVLILEEAGGRVTDIGGGGDWPANGFIATNGTLHPALLGCFPEKRSQPRRSSR